MWACCGRVTSPIADLRHRVLHQAAFRPVLLPLQTITMEAILLRPLPPFRAKPTRKPSVPKRATGEGRKDASAVTVKAQRHPVKLARLAAAPSLRILSRPAASPV
jgi:hypothetical protein